VVAGGILLDACCSPVWSAKCLPSRFGAGIWWQRETSYFLRVTWFYEASYRLGVWDVEVLIVLDVLFPPNVVSASQQDF
jgi:hypothetical protein